MWQRNVSMRHMLPQLMYGLLALLFCAWIIYQTPLTTILIATLFSLTGLPLYLLFARKQI
jgi:APA family basic amino acid/polyamine antiporter